MDRRDSDCIQIFNGQYAHKTCSELEDQRELTDSEKLDRYIMTLFKTDYVPQNIKRQIEEFIKEYNYTHSGIHKALYYFYEIKHGDIKKANGAISIVPYIYRQAYNYYFSIWQAQQSNSQKDISNYIPKVEEITIPNPKRQIKKRKLFSFLDDEVNDE